MGQQNKQAEKVYCVTDWSFEKQGNGWEYRIKNQLEEKDRFP